MRTLRLLHSVSSVPDALEDVLNESKGRVSWGVIWSHLPDASAWGISYVSCRHTEGDEGVV